MNAEFLHIALKEAQKRRGFTAPNPAVGAILVHDGNVISRGTHWACGEPHAEVMALANQVVHPDSTLYVTLEPCNHTGRTPPCTDFIYQRGIRRVVYGYPDPNPQVTGGGHRALTQMGVNICFDPTPEIIDFYRSYKHWHLTGRPWVTLKLAMSLDGKISGPQGERRKISGVLFDKFTHERRQVSDAILTSAQTLLSDNPRLDARLKSTTPKKVYALDSQLSLASRADLQIFQTASELVIFHRAARKTELPARQIDIGEDSLRQIIQRIGKEGVHDLWVEAGAKLTESLLRESLVDEAFICISSKALGEGKRGPDLNLLGYSASWLFMGEDAICRLVRPSHSTQ